MKDTREIYRGIGVVENDKYRVVTDTDEIAAMYSQTELEQMLVDGILGGGEWKTAKQAETPLAKMNKAELVAEAERLGVSVVPDSMTNKQIIEAIEAANK